MLKFNEYVKRMDESNTIGKHNDGNRQGNAGAYIGSDWSGSEAIPTMGMDGHPPHLPSLDLTINLPNTIPTDIPTVEKKAVIRVVEKNKNPIFIHLEDGTRIFLSLDEFKRITGNKPCPGKTMTVKFQRTSNDNRDIASQIQSIHCD